MKENKGVKFLTGFLAVILSIIFIVTSVATVCVAGVTSMLKPENIIKLVQSIDYTQIISEFTSGAKMSRAIGDDLSDMIDKDALGEQLEGIDTNVEIPGGEEILNNIELPEGVDSEMINSFLQSEAAKEIIEQYTNGLAAVLSGETVTEEFTVDQVKEIVNENMDEIVEIAQGYVGDELSEEAIKAKINEFIDTKAAEIIGTLPSFKELQQQFEGGLAAVLKVVSSPILTYICIGICVIIAMLIFACRFKNAQGLIWLGVDCMLAGFAVSSVKTAFDAIQPMITDMVSGILGNASSTIVASILSVVVDPITSGKSILFIAAAAFIAIYIVLFIIRKNKAKAPVANEAPEETMVPIDESYFSEAEAQAMTEAIEEPATEENVETNI